MPKIAIALIAALAALQDLTHADPPAPRPLANLPIAAFNKAVQGTTSTAPSCAASPGLPGVNEATVTAIIAAATKRNVRRSSSFRNIILNHSADESYAKDRDYLLPNNDWDQLKPIVQVELEARYPGLFTACEGWELHYLIAEDSGVELIHYVDDVPHGWYKILNEGAITSTSVCYKNCSP